MTSDPQSNPQAEEIRQALEDYEESDTLQAQRESLRQQRQELIQWSEEGRLPSQHDYGGIIGVQPTVLTELGIIDEQSSMAAFEDRQRYLHRTIKFRRDNLYFVVDTSNSHLRMSRCYALARCINPDDLDLDGAEEDLQAWMAFMPQVKRAMDGKSWAEIEADPTLGGIVGGIHRTSDIGMIFIYAPGVGRIGRISGFLYVGHPTSHDSWRV